MEAIDGNKLTIDFDKAGQKRVVDSFVEVGLTPQLSEGRPGGFVGDQVLPGWL